MTNHSTMSVFRGVASRLTCLWPLSVQLLVFVGSAFSIPRPTTDVPKKQPFPKEILIVQPLISRDIFRISAEYILGILSIVAVWLPVFRAKLMLGKWNFPFKWSLFRVDIRPLTRGYSFRCWKWYSWGLDRALLYGMMLWWWWLIIP